MIDPSEPVFRFAPSPNGLLHLGHAYSALVNFEMSQAIYGRFLLRMEDIDTVRCSPAYEDQIYDDLTWLGITWEQPVRRQSDHFDAYQHAFEALESEALVYPFTLSRADLKRQVEAHEQAGDIWPRDPDGAPLAPPRQPDADLHMDDIWPWRLDMKRALEIVRTPLHWHEFDLENEAKAPKLAEPERWGDVVITRKDTPTSYHLSVVVDDALQGVTHVVRGKDLEQATAVHRLLQNLLGLQAPLYHHHDLVMAQDGRKLSKSNNDTSLKSLREAGMTPIDIRRMVGL